MSVTLTLCMFRVKKIINVSSYIFEDVHFYCQVTYCLRCVVVTSWPPVFQESKNTKQWKTNGWDQLCSTSLKKVFLIALKRFVCILSHVQLVEILDLWYLINLVSVVYKPLPYFITKKIIGKSVRPCDNLFVVKCLFWEIC